MMKSFKSPSVFGERMSVLLFTPHYCFILHAGIGIDDTFVMLAAWRRTSVHNAVPERLANAFTDAAVSITITSVTDMLSFWIGIITPFPSVKIFCVYAGTCVTFTYLWHVTFFGACMAIAGYAEKDNRHAITCLKVIPKSLSSNAVLPFYLIQNYYVLLTYELLCDCA